MTPAIIAIDPGKTGAIAYDAPGAALQVYDMPDTPAGVVSLLRALSFGPDAFCLIEKQQAMPKQGVSSMFTLGEGYGFLQATVMTLGLPLDFVRPAEWKRKLGLTNADKTGSRAMAARLFPDQAELFARVKDHGRAESALLAVYARRHLIGERAAA